MSSITTSNIQHSTHNPNTSVAKLSIQENRFFYGTGKRQSFMELRADLMSPTKGISLNSIHSASSWVCASVIRWDIFRSRMWHISIPEPNRIRELSGKVQTFMLSRKHRHSKRLLNLCTWFEIGIGGITGFSRSIMFVTVTLLSAF